MYKHLFVLFLTAATTMASGEAPKKMVCIYTDNVVAIDGLMNEKDWSKANCITATDTRHHQTGNSLKVRTLWDDEYLYMFYEIKDKNLVSKQTVPDHPQLSRDDIAEFLIDAHNDKQPCWSVDDIVYHINLFGQKKDDRGTADCKDNYKWNGSAGIAVQLHGSLNDSSDVDEGYDVEVAIAWKEIGARPVAGNTIGIDFACGDEGRFFDWAGAWPFRSPNDFGNLVLKK